MTLFARLVLCSGVLLACFFPCMRGFAAEKRPPTGSIVPDLNFRDIRGLDRSLAELGQHKAWVFVFTTTSCPIVQRSMPKLVELNRRFGSQDVQFVAVNVGIDDSIREMAEQALDFGAVFPFVKDVDFSCATALGVTMTPEVAVLDHERRLVYRGRIDDQLRLGGTRPEPTRKDLEEALQQLLNGQPIAVPETPVDGCEISHPTPPGSGSADGLEYHGDIAPLLDRKCNHCHRPGTAAPFSLQTLADVSANSAMIVRVVEDERMPPWFASARHGKFQNDPSLTGEEKSTLLRWIKSDRREGKPSAAQLSSQTQNAEATADTSDGWRIGEPDVVITMLEQHEIPETGFVPYRYAILPWIFLQDTWVEAFEIRPDNRSIVHHCNMARRLSMKCSTDLYSLSSPMNN